MPAVSVTTTGSGASPSLSVTFVSVERDVGAALRDVESAAEAKPADLEGQVARGEDLHRAQCAAGGDRVVAGEVRSTVALNFTRTLPLNVIPGMPTTSTLPVALIARRPVAVQPASVLFGHS